MDWVIHKWYRTRCGEVGQCVSTDGYPQPIGVRVGSLRYYCVGGEFFCPGSEAPQDIVAGPFDDADAAKQSPPVVPDYAADLETLMDCLLVRLDLAASDNDRLATVAAMLAVRRVGAAVLEMEAALAAIGIK